MSNEELHEIRREAIAWVHNTTDHPIPNGVVAEIITELLQMRGEA